MTLNRAEGENAALRLQLEENASLLQQVRVLSEARHTANEQLSRLQGDLDETQQTLDRLSAHVKYQDDKLEVRVQPFLCACIRRVSKPT